MTTETIGDLATRWLPKVRMTVRESTFEGYERAVRRHVLPAFRDVPASSLTKRAVRDFLVRQLEHGHGGRYVRSTLYCLTAILDVAVDEDELSTNPARGAGHRLFRGMSRPAPGDTKAMTPEQLRAFLASVAVVRPRMHDYFLMLGRSGLRPGEGLGLRWPDLDFEARQASIRCSWSSGRVGPTKTSRNRLVDLSAQVVRALEARHQREPHTAWVFQSTQRSWPWDESHVQKGMRAAIVAAGLPRFHPHCLRHTFATSLLEAGVPMTYVQQQLGHSSISMTVDVYGSWRRQRNLAAVDALDGG